MASRKDGTPILMGDPDYNPVSHDKPAPGGMIDHTSDAIHKNVGSPIRDAILNATGLGGLSKALGGK